MKTIIGIDYSLTSPAICVHSGDEWSIKNCLFYYFKKKGQSSAQFKPSEYPEWTHDQERYQKLTAWVVGIVNEHQPEKAYIENYSYASTGRVFHIAENTGLMKYGLWVSSVPYELFAPTAIKKFATDKGNAKKEMMVEAFEKDTGLNIFDKIGVKPGAMSPTSDIVDAYWICKMGFMNEKNNNT